jgi:hypothetical protein
MTNDIKELSLFEYLQKKYRDALNEHADHIATGNCKDFADYKRLTGVIEGLALAERELLDWIERNVKEE